MTQNAYHDRSSVGRWLVTGIIIVAFVTFDGRAANAPLVVGIQPNPPPTAGRYASSITESATRFRIPERWIGSVIAAESDGDATATSPKGAMGLMQIMPRTWADLRARYGLGANPYDPHDNILAGTAYLRELYDRYGEGGFLAAYNAGPGRYEEYQATGRPLPPDTLAYIARVSKLIDNGNSVRLGAAPSSFWATSRLFIVRDDAAVTANHTTRQMPIDSLSAAQHRQSSFRLRPQSVGLFVPLSREGTQP